MSLTNAYAAKDAIFDRLLAAAVPAGALDGVGVAYAWNAGLGLQCVYGGGISFEHEDQVGEGPGISVGEIALISLYVQVTARPPVPVADTDATAATIGATVVSLLKANPALSGGRWRGIGRSFGDYSQTDDETRSTLSIPVRVDTDLGYG